MKHRQKNYTVVLNNTLNDQLYNRQIGLMMVKVSLLSPTLYNLVRELRK